MKEIEMLEAKVAEILTEQVDNAMSSGFSMSSEASMDPNWGWSPWEKIFLWIPVRFTAINGEEKFYWGFTMRRESTGGLTMGPHSTPKRRYQYKLVSEYNLEQMAK